MSPTSKSTAEIINKTSQGDPADLRPPTGGLHCRSWPWCEAPHCGSCQSPDPRKRPEAPGETEGRGAEVGLRRRAGMEKAHRRETCSHLLSSWQDKKIF